LNLGSGSQAVSEYMTSLLLREKGRLSPGAGRPWPPLLQVGIVVNKCVGSRSNLATEVLKPLAAEREVARRANIVAWL
jgi:hypothetical protein